VLDSLEFGNPLAVSDADEPLPDLDFGPLITAGKASELAADVEEAIDRGGVPLYRGSTARAHFVDGQDTSAYVPPVAIFDPRGARPCTTPSPSGPSTPWWSWTPKPSCWRR